MIDRLKLNFELSEKQKLYKQMLRDKITGPTVDKVVKEIAAINLKLYNREPAQ